MIDIDVLLCYRGRYHRQIQRLDALLEAHDLRVAYDAEILSEGTPYAEAEVEWVSLGDSDGGESVAWRGPLSEAVKRSALIVFLIDPQDPSVNVMNEILWAARAGRPLFVIFESHGASHSKDFEGINIGMLQGMYALATGKPESPAFGYHFVTHEEDDGLDERLTILVNRILSYLGQVRRDEVPRVRMDDHSTISDVENAPPARARRRLLEAQEKIAKALGVTSPPNRGDPLQNTLAYLHAGERDGRVRSGRIYPHDSPFSYPEESERERYRRTEALVNLIRPGPYEDPPFLAMFARELVSVEMVLPRPVRDPVLVGTVAFCPSNLPVDFILEPEFGILLVDGTFVDFTYEMLKAAVMSWKITSPPGRLPVSMSTKEEDTREVIAGSPGLVAGFARSLKHMLQAGLPGKVTEGAPPFEYHPALKMLGVFQKRFHLAVAMARIVELDAARTGAGSSQGAEDGAVQVQFDPSALILAADALAARWVFAGAQALDSTDPTMALQGILLVLASQDLIEKSLAGFVAPEIVSTSVRAQGIARFFVEYATAGELSPRQAEERREGSQAVAATLDMLWQAATEAGELDATSVEPAKRWRQHIQP